MSDRQLPATPPQPDPGGSQLSAGSVIAAIVLAISGLLSLLMTACFGFFGIAKVASPGQYTSTVFGFLLLIVGALLAALTVFLFRLAFRVGSGRK
jgi:hypothetical protein